MKVARSPDLVGIDYDGDSLIVAGAGRLWWKSTYEASYNVETGYYPGLDPEYFDDTYNDYDGQLTVSSGLGWL